MQNEGRNNNKADTHLSILRYTIPNSFTALSLLLGVSSIVTTQLGSLELAGWMIVWCGLLDVLDGLAARLLNATSSFGAEFDSMADLVSFGVAPAILMMNAGMQIGGIELGSEQFWVLLLACGVFVLCGAMRLARFNLTSDQPSGGWFVGIPITAVGGGMVSSIVIVMSRHEPLVESMPLQLYIPIVMFVFAIMMVSRLRFPKATKRKSMLINIFQVTNIALIYYCGIFRTWPEYLLGMGLFTLVAGIIAGRITRDSA